MTYNDQNRPVIKYIGLFAITYSIFLLTISIILSMIGEYMSGIYYAIAILGAGRVPVYRFLKENGRMYTKVEKIKLIVGTFLCALFINATGYKMLSHNRLDYGILVGSVFNLFILWYIFGPLSQSISKR
jgi:hypothetical protein